ncbi:hypothetical protein T484DRAFT_1753826 [Baffinella frigidus]|nr:hypothetical protein T484DRAFT_1753826 [Cryptophyta sp. CCMP2293]
MTAATAAVCTATSGTATPALAGVEKKRKRPFRVSDDMRGWGMAPEDNRDHRLCKNLRTHQAQIALTPMHEKLDVVNITSLPSKIVFDPDETSIGDKYVEVDRGDVYEGYWRTHDLSLRGTFVNGEPVWGEVEYRNGMSYTGSLRGGKPNGFGTKRMGFSVYKGRFKDGDRHGNGLFLDARNFRLYAGPYVDDKPHGLALCIRFCWCPKLKVVQHVRSVVRFQSGDLVSSKPAPSVNVSVMCGLSQEEFLKIYREGEKALEDSMIRNTVSGLGFEDVFWTPAGLATCPIPIYAEAEEKSLLSDF